MAFVLRRCRGMPLAERHSREPNLEPDLKIERMIAEIAATIRSAEPGMRSELKELTEALLHDEISSIPESSRAAAQNLAAKSSNPLFAGILLTLFGLGFSLLFPLVGLALAAVGIGLSIWGVIMSGLRR